MTFWVIVVVGVSASMVGMALGLAEMALGFAMLMVDGWRGIRERHRHRG